MSFVCGPSQSCLRHPPPWMGYAGRNSETESAPPERLGKDARPPSTVYVWLVVPLHRRNSREELRPEALQRPHSFCVYGKKRSLNPPASDMRFVVRFCAHLLRSSSAYVPSARQAGPHAHPL